MLLIAVDVLIGVSNIVTAVQSAGSRYRRLSRCTKLVYNSRDHPDGFEAILSCRFPCESLEEEREYDDESGFHYISTPIRYIIYVIECLCVFQQFDFIYYPDISSL